jgi:hypothetical protein
MTAPRRHWKKGNLVLTTLLLLGLPGYGSAEQAAATAEAPASEINRGTVARAIFTSQIVDREPVDSLTHVPNSQDRVFFFSDLRGLNGQIVTHRWEYNGKVMAEVKFKVGGPRWRVYSSKNLLPEWTGKWTVVVSDESGWPLKASIFEYTAAEPADTAATTPATKP